MAVTVFIKNYGMSEMFLVSCDPPCHAGRFLPERDAKRIFGSAGKLASSNKLKVSQFLLIPPESASISPNQVIDVQTGRKLGPGQVGEICVHNPFMMKEYLNRPNVSCTRY